MKKNRNFKVQESREDRLEALRVSRENLLTMNKPRKKVQPSFLAKYDGQECPKCFVNIAKGDRVRFNSDDVLVHATHKTVEKEYTVCDSCFLTKPCDCDES